MTVLMVGAQSEAYRDGEPLRGVLFALPAAVSLWLVGLAIALQLV